MGTLNCSKLVMKSTRFWLLFSFFIIAPTCCGGTLNVADLEKWLEDYASAPIDGLAQSDYGKGDLGVLNRYIPPGFQQQFDFSKLKIKVSPTKSYARHDLYMKATEKYKSTAKIAENGSLENYVAGQPFSNLQILDATPRIAGLMIAWNNVYRWQNFGYKADLGLSYIERGGQGKNRLLDGMKGGGNVVRDVVAFYQRVYLSGLATEYDNNYRLQVSGSDTLLYKEYMEMFSPYDLAGLKFIIERPLNQELGDQVNSYLPSERRVRRLSAKERADSFIGTHWTLDDLEGWSGMVLDNEWRYLGNKVVLSIPNSEHEAPQFYGPLSTTPDDTWELRECYVVEAVPKWSGHPYGRRIIFIDKETFTIPYTLVFNQKGELWKILQIVYQDSKETASRLPADSPLRWRASVVIDITDSTANIAVSLGETEFPTVSPSKVRRLFSVSNLSEGR